MPESPNVFWPADHAWLVATETDLDSSYIGGSAALGRDLMADRRLETLPARATDPVHAFSDEIIR